MKIFGIEIRRSKESPERSVKMLSPVRSSGWFDVIRESFGGAWQSNIEVDAPRNVLAFPGVFAPLTLIASDISKLRIKLTEEDDDGICTEVKTTSPFLPVLRKPNPYQTRIQFLEQWILSKLLHGNTYALKGRETARGMVNRLYILDAKRVVPLVASNGDVYYKCSPDNLSGLPEVVTVPASEIIHDRWNCLWHPLVGISPMYACGRSATQGGRIQANSTKFFDNMSRPSGVLTAPGQIDDETAARIKNEWDQNFSGGNIGKTAVLGNGLKYDPMAIPALASQLVDQWKLTTEDCAKVFHVPLFKVGGPVPIGTTVEALQQVYYTDCLQALIESLELCLDEGLALPAEYYTELDLDGLLRMDTAARYDALGKMVGSGIMKIDEGRAKENMKAVPGGNACYLQQQNFSTEALAKRDALADPFANATPGRRSADNSMLPPADQTEDPAAAAHKKVAMSLAEIDFEASRSLELCLA